MNSSVNMQILFMHPLQELHHETLHTLGATFICSVLDLRRKERKGKNCHVLALAWVTSVWSVFKNLGILFLHVFYACFPSLSARQEENSSTFSMTKGLTDLCAIITPPFLSRKEGFYSKVCAFFRVYFLQWTQQVR